MNLICNNGNCSPIFKNFANERSQDYVISQDFLIVSRWTTGSVIAEKDSVRSRITYANSHGENGYYVVELYLKENAATYTQETVWELKS